MQIFYKENLIGTRRIDFFVEQKISVELKAFSYLEPGNLAQAINYLEVYNVDIGMLLNFGCSRLEFKRLVNSKYKIK